MMNDHMRYHPFKQLQLAIIEKWSIFLNLRMLNTFATATIVIAIGDTYIWA